MAILPCATSEERRILNCDIIFHGGSVLTMADGEPSCEAVAVAGDRIVATGSLAHVSALKGPETEVVDLQGACLMPGFVEAHGHAIWSGMCWGDPIIDIRSVHTPTYEAVIEKIKRRVAKAKPGEFIMAVGLDPIFQKGMREPTRAELDEIAPNNPLAVVYFVFHSMYLNSAAVEVLDLEAHDDGSYQYVRNDKGELWMLKEHASFDAQKEFYKLCGGKERALSELGEWTMKYARAGYTTVSELGVYPEWSGFFLELMQRAEQPVRVVAYERIVLGVPMVGTPGAGNDRYRTVGAKLWADGSIFVGNISMKQPYLENDLTTKGLALSTLKLEITNFTDAQLKEQLEDALRQGWQLAIHAQGDRTVDQVLACLEELLPQYPDAGGPHRLEHGVYMTSAQVRRAHELGLVCSFLAGIVYEWGNAVKESLVGPERGDRILPCGSAARVGMRFSLHCDSPLTWPDALGCVELATTRITRTGMSLGTDECVEIGQALRAVTIDAAYHLRMDHAVGSIESGKYADFVILRQNPLETPLTSLRGIEVIATYSGGRRIAL